MQSENHLFGDVAKLFNGAAGTIAGMGREAEANARARAREWIGGLDFIARDEFNAVKAMAVAALGASSASAARAAARHALATADLRTPEPTHRA